MPNPAPNMRQKMLRDFLPEVCRDFCDRKGYRYLHWERAFPVDGRSKDYQVVCGADGMSVTRQLDEQAISIIRAMEDWAVTGKGTNPALAWRTSRLSTVQGTVQTTEQRQDDLKIR
jgi:hypothetical protein